MCLVGCSAANGQSLRRRLLSRRFERWPYVIFVKRTKPIRKLRRRLQVQSLLVHISIARTVLPQDEAGVKLLSAVR